MSLGGLRKFIRGPTACVGTAAKATATNQRHSLVKDAHNQEGPPDPLFASLCVYSVALGSTLFKPSHYYHNSFWLWRFKPQTRRALWRKQLATQALMF